MKSRKVSVLIIFIFLGLCSNIIAHSGKPEYRVIIDTDCGIDDFRAITLLLASPEVEVLGITTSDGTLDPAEGQKRIESVLGCFHHEGIPVARGKEILKAPPGWRDMNESISWTDEPAYESNDTDLDAADFIIEMSGKEEQPVTIICLGSLSSIAQAIQKADSINKKIERILWYNGGKDIKNGTNYSFDTASAGYIMNLGISIDIVSNNKQEELKIDKALMNTMAGINSVYARQIYYVHNQDKLRKYSHRGYLNIWDDLLPVYLLLPEAFSADTLAGYTGLRLINPVNHDGIKKQIIDILDPDKYIESKVFEGFPVDPSLYREDVAMIMDDIINKHGMNEWRLGVLTNELHGHLGIYALVGTKMGLRAREFFNIGLDDISIVSYAGREPPLSCMNDGLQVSTGGTLGHGLIHLTDDSNVKPVALFSYKDRTIIIRLKDKYLNIIKEDIKQCISENGNLTKDYWVCVRKLAIKYWLEWDRNTMFELIY